MDFEQARFNMIEQQIRPWDVLDQDVLDALRLVQRELFVAPAQQALAFADVELPTACGQCLLPPKIEAKALQALAVRPGDSILEVGAGSGHMAALLAARGEWVRSIEIEPELVNLAAGNLARNGVDNVIVEEGDGLAGWPSGAPYDVIMLSGGVTEVPAVLIEQLKTGGRLFAFVGSAPLQQGVLLHKQADGSVMRRVVLETLVTPLRNCAAQAFAF
ncbi:protein-L-isoaspartate O-methyltransferase [Viridibacterium curvum]|uniref:Protein-L-isoaspartate O-methyltransferase n=1 Tax=Viridibacterium curvum TaxID=1101404 RepID=A0ABP9QLX7_9RHOO